MDYRSVDQTTPIVSKQLVKDGGAPRKQLENRINFVPQSKVQAQLFMGSSSGPAAASPALTQERKVIQPVQNIPPITEQGCSLSPKTPWSYC